MSNYTIHDIQHCLKNIHHRCVGDWNEKYFSELSTPSKADAHSLIWIASDRKDKHELIAHTQAKIIVCDLTIDPTSFSDKAFILTENPKLAFLRIGNTLFANAVTCGIHHTAIVHPEAIIEDQVYIGPYVIIGKCHIKSHAVIHAHCHLFDNTHVGERVVIYSGCKIGAPGLGHIFNEQGNLENFPHVSGVSLGNDVELGVNTTIAKGALKMTTVGRHTKVDCQVQIGHNVTIGENVIIAANAVIGGSAVVGNKVFIGIGVTVIGDVHIADGVYVGAGVTVLETVRECTKLAVRAPVVLV